MATYLCFDIILGSTFSMQWPLALIHH